MTLSAGRSAPRAWRTLPVAVRDQAIALGRTGHPYPDPGIQRIIVGLLARGSTVKSALGSVMSFTIAASSASLYDFLRYGVRLSLIVAQFVAFGILAVVITRWSRLRYLGPNVKAVAMATPAPTGPVTLIRSAPSMVAMAGIIAVGLVSMVPLVRYSQEAAADGSTGAWAVFALLAAAVTAVVGAAIAGVIGYFILALGPAGARRELGVIDADGIRIHHLRLTVPWRDVRKINGNDEDGVTGLGIWLIDPARTLSTAKLSPFRRRVLLRNALGTGWLRLPTTPLTGPAGTPTVVLAIAMHRDYLNKHREVAA